MSYNFPNRNPNIYALELVVANNPDRPVTALMNHGLDYASARAFLARMDDTGVTQDDTCGTDTGYYRHSRRGETACEDCHRAHTVRRRHAALRRAAADRAALADTVTVLRRTVDEMDTVTGGAA